MLTQKTKQIIQSLIHKVAISSLSTKGTLLGISTMLNNCWGWGSKFSYLNFHWGWFKVCKCNYTGTNTAAWVARTTGNTAQQLASFAVSSATSLGTRLPTSLGTRLPTSLGMRLHSSKPLRHAVQRNKKTLQWSKFYDECCATVWMTQSQYTSTVGQV